VKSLFMRQFLTTVALLIISFALTGALFFSFSYQYIMSDKKEALQKNADTVAHSALAYRKTGDLGSNWDFRMNITSTAQAAGIHIFVCDPGGVVISCSDQDFRSRYIGRILDKIVVDTVTRDGEYIALTDLGGFYDTQYYVVGRPIASREGNANLGMVFVSADVSSLKALTRTLLGTFIFVAICVMLLAFFFTTYASQRQTKPLMEMAEAARRFAHGQWEVRVRDYGRKDELGQLATAFNAMADSLSRGEKLRREFVSNVSHELKTPMTTIAGFIDGILDGTIPPEREKQYLSIVSGEISRLSRLVRRMLEISRLQSDDVKLNKISFDLVELMLRTLLTFEQKIEAKGLTVMTKLPRDAVMVNGDPDLITQVIYNLIENAVKFSSKGGQLGLEIVRKGGKAHVTVRNEGETIPPEQQALIFDRFHKADTSRSADRDGVGLGLYLVKTILDNHGEDISLQSKNGVTEFTFTLGLADRK
jgi:signal transduction histidine kinase